MKAARTLLVAASSLIALAASAQQPPAPPPAGDPQPPQSKDGVRETGQPGPNDRAELKARAERRLAEAKRQQERWEAAIKKLDAGAPVGEVEAEMRGPRPFQGTRGQDRTDGNRGLRGGAQGGATGGGSEHAPPPIPGTQGVAGGKLSHEEMLEFLDKDFPDIAARFKTAMKEDPGITSRVLDRMEPRVRELLAERDPDMHALRSENFKTDFELLHASKAFIEANRHNAPPDQVKAAGDALRALLGEHFDLQIKMHRQEVVMLERRIKDIQIDVEKQLAKRDEFIEKRMEGLQRIPKDREREQRGGLPPKP